MEWNDVWKIVLCVIASFGGIGGVVVFVVKFTSEKIADRLSQKYENKLQKELEQYKINLEGKNYISKNQYDVEFEIYRSLSKTFFEMIAVLNSIFSSRHQVKEIETVKGDSFKKRVTDLVTKTADAQDCLLENGAFIPKDLYEKYEMILNESSKLYWEYYDALISKSFNETISNEDWCKERYGRADKIDKDFKMLNNDLRIYLQSLTIVD